MGGRDEAGTDSDFRSPERRLMRYRSVRCRCPGRQWVSSGRLRKSLLGWALDQGLGANDPNLDPTRAFRTCAWSGDGQGTDHAQLIGEISRFHFALLRSMTENQFLCA